MTELPPEGEWITFTIDGREAHAPDGEWLVDAAKRNDIEIPFFCYEKKLVDPVGACRMCLVEIEGIPKLQTSCSTPVKDGMVVYTQNQRVKESQEAIVEFLLVNHPLDCPVCDKGGECPLQDISYGWGPGRSRSVDDKRNFPKPIALSPLVAIDRERCILCYRCVRFSQEASEDYQLTFLERGDHTFVGTFDGRPYVAPFSGNIIELCPVGALTSTAYRFRARPWDIEQAGSVCTLCPSQCNISFTVRDDRVERVLERENDGVDNGWLCDMGRFGYQSIHSDNRITEPLIRDGGFLRPVSWERALDAAVGGLRKAEGAVAALIGGGTTNEEGYLLQRLMREALRSGSIDSRTAAALDPAIARALAEPQRSAAVADIDAADLIVVIGADPINESPILDLRIRKALRHFDAKLVVANDAPTALDGGAAARLGYRPGRHGVLLAGLAMAQNEAAFDKQAFDRLAAEAGIDPQDLREVADLIASSQRVVVIWGERIGHPLFDLDRVKYLEIPAAANARGLREVGCLPNMAPGLEPIDAAGASATEIREAARAGTLGAIYLMHSDPLRERPGRAGWEEALAKAFVVAHSQFLDESLEAHADVVFPAEAYAEKEGTVTHPDGRLQRLRPAIGRGGEVQAEWALLVELGRRLGLDPPEGTSSAAVYDELCASVGFYSGITLDEIAGKGVRWPERNPLAAAEPIAPDWEDAPAGEGELELGILPNLWTRPECENSPVLDFLAARQQLLINPADAERLGVVDGESVGVSNNGHTIEARAHVTARARAGSVYLFEGTRDDNVNLLSDGRPISVAVDVATGALR